MKKNLFIWNIDCCLKFFSFEFWSHHHHTPTVHIDNHGAISMFLEPSSNDWKAERRTIAKTNVEKRRKKPLILNDWKKKFRKKKRNEKNLKRFFFDSFNVFHVKNVWNHFSNDDLLFCYVVGWKWLSWMNIEKKNLLFFSLMKN